MQYVYLVQLEKDCAKGIFKIGKTNEPHRRMLKYEWENKCPIKVILCKQVKNMNFVEKILIKAFIIKFGQPARGNEYFKVNCAEAVNDLEVAKEFFLSIFNQRDIITLEYLEYVRWYKLCKQELGKPPYKGMKFSLWKKLNQLYIQNNSTLNQPIIC